MTDAFRRESAEECRACRAEVWEFRNRIARFRVYRVYRV